MHVSRTETLAMPFTTQSFVDRAEALDRSSRQEKAARKTWLRCAIHGMSCYLSRVTKRTPKHGARKPRHKDKR